LITASTNNSIELARFMLERYFDVNNIVDNNGRTALYHATINRHAAMISLLFEFRASVNIQDNLGRTYIKYVLPTTNTLVLLYISTRRVSTPRGHLQWLL
jgi:hypothetical protein